MYALFNTPLSTFLPHPLKFVAPIGGWAIGMAFFVYKMNSEGDVEFDLSKGKKIKNRPQNLVLKIPGFN